MKIRAVYTNKKRLQLLKPCDPDWIQTSDLLLRRQLLYSAELPDRPLLRAANIKEPSFAAKCKCAINFTATFLTNQSFGWYTHTRYQKRQRL